MKVGDTYKTSYGDLMVIEYNSAKSVLVEFLQTGFRKITRAEHIRNNLVKDPTTRRVHGVGIYRNIDGSVKKRSYNVWADILRRCYDTESQNYHRYGGRGCVICDEWKLFSKFEEWFNSNYIKDYELDKDLLFADNLIYSPSTCVFIPKRVNTLLGLSNRIRDTLPIGVREHSEVGRKKHFQAVLKMDNTTISLGYYTTPEEAFYTYKKRKEAYVKSVALDYYKQDLIDEKIYMSLLSWEVNIDD